MPTDLIQAKHDTIAPPSHHSDENDSDPMLSGTIKSVPNLTQNPLTKVKNTNSTTFSGLMEERNRLPKSSWPNSKVYLGTTIFHVG
jgi:hypothetical protein